VQTVAFDGSQPPSVVGHYTYTVTTDEWSWSAGMYTMHGYDPYEVPATTEVMLSHKHPDDRARTLAVLEAAVETGAPFSCYHRIIDGNKRVRSVLSVGHGIKAPDGRVARVEGYFVDLTQLRHDETEAEIQNALARVAEHREAIDEVKGMIMVATGCDGDTAFACLRRYSQDANLKVHEIAHRLVEAVGPDNLGTDFVMTFLDELVRASRRPA
jgi:hypothetical protein